MKISKVEDWIPPIVIALKFNVDGSARGSLGLAGIGGVHRDHKRNVLCIFSANVGFQDAITIEILAIARACKLYVSRPELIGRDIAVVRDSKVAVSWVNSGGIGSIKHVQTIYDFRKHLNSLGKVCVMFSLRASNSVADMLVKNGLGGSRDLLKWNAF
ncbi:hypothetical protein Dsin_032010 [Dipteronia sinensis]|uniref:RNase H type-1 domain-containing protein n=1 Tax=Dipteronia sinensis TaxID=43782 RepID=A0AAD9ZNX3_9ROSI|nr:hypothetical protein Dsin_032010 [Dipteronia sinensis]